MKFQLRMGRSESVRGAGIVRTLIGTIVAAFALVSCGGGVPVPPAARDAVQAEREKQVFVEAMKPRRAGTPVIAVVALNEGTEITDFLLPYSVLTRAGVADVRFVAPRTGRVSLYPAFEVEAAQDFARFDEAYPSGADYVIVPAMIRDDDPAITSWLRQQAERGARIIGVCVGALVVGRAGLLDGRRFVTHWYYRSTPADRHAGAVYVPHQRYVVDRDVSTTTGITASMPAILALIEALGGRAKARDIAAELGVDSWAPVHDSSIFGLNVRRAWNYVLTRAAFWRHEDWSVDVRDGMDDVSLALAVDAWSRTGSISVEASAPGPVKLRSGLTLVAQPAAGDLPRVPLTPGLTPAQQLDRTLCEIGERFGEARRKWVMMELEYPGDGSTCER
jgi:putative intracellular protease/amidase